MLQCTKERLQPGFRLQATRMSASEVGGEKPELRDPTET